MRRTALGVLAAVALVVPVAVSSVGVAVGQAGPPFVRGEPTLDVTVPQSELPAGETTQLTVQVTNDGDVTGGVSSNRALVTTARAVTLDASAEGTPLTVETREQAIGSVPDGQVADVPLGVTVPAGVDPGRYTLTVELTYSYTSVYAPRSGVRNEQTRTVTRTVTVVVPDRPRFSLRTVGTDLQAGGPGTVTVAVTNTGTETARALAVGLQSTSPAVALGGGDRDTARLDRLAPNATELVTYGVTVAPDATDRAYPLDASVQFTDTDGVSATAEGLSLGVRPADQQRFTVTVTNSTLRVGESGVLAATVRNEGPVAAEAVAVSLGNDSFQPRVGSYAVGDLAVNETATVRFRATVPETADAAPQRVDLLTRYRTVGDAERATTAPVVVPVADSRDGVAVTAVAPQFGAGESGQLTVRLRNRRETEIRDVRVFLNVSDPLGSDFPTAVVPSLAPGETGNVTFDVDVAGGALDTRYPAVAVLEYTVPDDDRPTVQTETLAVAVSTAERDLPLVELAAVALVLVLVVVGGWWLYGERLV